MIGAGSPWDGPSEGVALAAAVASAASAMVLLRAALWKLNSQAAFRRVLLEHGSFARRHAGVLAVAVPAAELCVAAGVTLAFATAAAGPHVAVPAHRAAHGLLLGAGAWFLAYAIRRLAAGPAVPCGCLNADDRFGASTVVRAGFLAGSGAAGLLVGPLRPAAEVPGPAAGASWYAVVAAGGLLVAMILLVGLPALTFGPNLSGPPVRLEKGGEQECEDVRARRR